MTRLKKSVTVKTYCGTMTYDEKGKLLLETYSPGHVGLTDKDGKSCENCLHWKKRMEDDGAYYSTQECPCFECAGLCYSVNELLFFWEPAVEEGGVL